MIRRWLAIAAILLSVATSAAAQELTTDAERTWRELRNSSDVKTKFMAERWYGAIKLQEWSDASGKFKTTAKYLAHDPNLAWVKLRVIQGTGDKRVVKDVTIPLEKLSKVCQARVRKIGVLSEKVADAIEAEKDNEKQDADGEGRAGELSDEGLPGEEPRGGRGGYDAGLAGMDPEQVTAEGERTSRGRGQETPAPQPAIVSNDGPPLPALLPGLPAMPAESPAPAEPQASTRPIAAGIQPGDEDWRTSYDAFRANIKPASNRSLIEVDWGDLHALKQAHDTLLRLESAGSIDEAGLAEISQLLDAVGEVNWETTLTDTSDQHGDWTRPLGLPMLPEPLGISFILDPERDPGPWQNLKAGDRVQFIGRFYSLDEDHRVTVAIRFREDQPADEIAPTEQPRR
jgi:hypothetical protein